MEIMITHAKVLQIVRRWSKTSHKAKVYNRVLLLPSKVQ